MAPSARVPVRIISFSKAQLSPRSLRLRSRVKGTGLA
jgi:hypothetical protein